MSHKLHRINERLCKGVWERLNCVFFFFFFFFFEGVFEGTQLYSRHT